VAEGGTRAASRAIARRRQMETIPIAAAPDGQPPDPTVGTGCFMLNTDRICLQCGTTSNGDRAVVCRRCGLRFGDEPRRDAELPTCPICYVTVDDDGLTPSYRNRLQRISLVAHMEEHEAFPPGDDDWLGTLRRGDQIAVGRFSAPFDLVRRYLVTGQIDGGRNRTLQHNAVLTAMSQIKRWGRNPDVFGDQPAWQEARAQIAAVMDRYAQGRRTPW